MRSALSASKHRFDQTSNYSFGAALTFLPHVLGNAQAVTGPLTSWSSIAHHARLMVLFGGANPKNMQVVKGGCGAHSSRGWLAELARAGVEVVNISPIRDDGPELVTPEWIPIRPNTDTAMLMALTHTLLVEGRSLVLLAFRSSFRSMSVAHSRGIHKQTTSSMTASFMESVV